MHKVYAKEAERDGEKKEEHKYFTAYAQFHYKPPKLTFVLVGHKQNIKDQNSNMSHIWNKICKQFFSPLSNCNAFVIMYIRHAGR